MTTTSTAQAAAEHLAAALTRAGIPADHVDLSGCHAARIELTISGRYRALYLEPDDGIVYWQLDSGASEVLNEGTWPPATGWRRLLGDHRVTIARVRGWLKAHSATVGRPRPAPIEELIGREEDCWVWVFSLVTSKYAEALVGGRMSPDDGPEALAALYPELTEEHRLFHGGDGWEDGIDLIQALAHGRIMDLDSAEDSAAWRGQSVFQVNGHDLTEHYGPAAVPTLRSAFNGDVTAAATAFLNRKRPA